MYLYIHYMYLYLHLYIIYVYNHIQSAQLKNRSTLSNFKRHTNDMNVSTTVLMFISFLANSNTM